MTTTETTAEIAPVAPAARVLASRTVMTLATLDDVARVAGIAARSGLARVSKPEEAAIILMTGMELGLTPMQSLRGIYIVEGRPVLAADTMVAIVTRSGACRYWRTIETSAERCTIETQRADDDTVYRRAWTLDDAKRAGLMGKGTWAKYPAAMLRHRVAADMAREVYPEILLGMYDPDEISTDSIDAKPSPQRARVEVRAEAPALPPPVVVAPPAVDVRDLAPMGVEAPAQVIVAQPVEPAPLAFATPGLSKAEMTAMLATIAQCATIADLDRERGTMRPDVSTRATPAQRATLRKAAEAKRAALTPQPPPTGTDSPGNARNDTSTTNDTTADAAPAGEAASASRERIASAGGVRAYLRAKGSRREVEAAVRAHGRHVAGLAQIAAERLDALTQADADGARPTRDTLLALALRWSAEGPVAEMRRAA